MSVITDLFATKIGMAQAWTQEGKRIPVTKLKAHDNVIVGVQTLKATDFAVAEVAYGDKKLKNVNKPMRARLEKLELKKGFTTVKGVRVKTGEEIGELGSVLTLDSVLEVGDIVQVQGVTRGKGFTGGMKRHGFHGGPATHGQSDRARAVGSIGQQDTGRVFKGKKMPGHSGDILKTIRGLVVLHVDTETKEVWLSGPVPGSLFSNVKVIKTGKKKNIQLNKKASGLKEAAEVSTETPEENTVQE